MQTQEKCSGLNGDRKASENFKGHKAHASSHGSKDFWDFELPTELPRPPSWEDGKCYLTNQSGGAWATSNYAEKRARQTEDSTKEVYYKRIYLARAIFHDPPRVVYAEFTVR